MASWYLQTRKYCSTASIFYKPSVLQCIWRNKKSVLLLCTCLMQASVGLEERYTLPVFEIVWCCRPASGPVRPSFCCLLTPISEVTWARRRCCRCCWGCRRCCCLSAWPARRCAGHFGRSAGEEGAVAAAVDAVGQLSQQGDRQQLLDRCCPGGGVEAAAAGRIGRPQRPRSSWWGLDARPWRPLRSWVNNLIKEWRNSLKNIRKGTYSKVSANFLTYMTPFPVPASLHLVSESHLDIATFKRGLPTGERMCIYRFASAKKHLENQLVLAWPHIPTRNGCGRRRRDSFFRPTWLRKTL